jgi:hypothetical protein
MHSYHVFSNGKEVLKMAAESMDIVIAYLKQRRILYDRVVRSV